MSFQIRPTREILVVPALPPALRRLPELGLNLLWSWNHSMRAVFRRLDPAAWKASNHNPVVMLGQVEQVALERAAADPRYLTLYKRACEILDTYLEDTPPATLLIAYFSMEYGLLGLASLSLFRRPRRPLRRPSSKLRATPFSRSSASASSIKTVSSSRNSNPDGCARQDKAPPSTISYSPALTSSSSEPTRSAERAPGFRASTSAALKSSSKSGPSKWAA